MSIDQAPVSSSRSAESLPARTLRKIVDRLRPTLAAAWARLCRMVAIPCPHLTIGQSADMTRAMPRGCRGNRQDFRHNDGPDANQQLDRLGRSEGNRYR